MPGPTTASLDGDVKELRAGIHKLEIGQAEIQTELRLLVKIAAWGVGLIATTLITGIVSSVWWASGINSEVKHLANQVDEVRKTQAQQGELIAGLRPKTALEPPPSNTHGVESAPRGSISYKLKPGEKDQ